jgi:N-acetylglutamate synthase-like GNAT family acetyltransferase
MQIKKADAADFPQIIHLAKKYDLDYAGMEADDYWVAAEKERIWGICGLKKHPDCLELCSLGVDEEHRGRGLARRLVLALIHGAGRDLYLATIIPEFFEPFGFVRAASVPASMVKKSDWCAGCPRERCVVMLRAGR